MLVAKQLCVYEDGREKIEYMLFLPKHPNIKHSNFGTLSTSTKTTFERLSLVHKMPYLQDRSQNIMDGAYVNVPNLHEISPSKNIGLKEFNNSVLVHNWFEERSPVGNATFIFGFTKSAIDLLY